MSEKLTDKLVKSLEAPETGSRLVFDGGAGRIKGFAVRIYAPDRRGETRKAFVMNYRRGGRERRLTIGDYGTWTVEAARRRAKELRQAIDNGDDPAQARQDEREAPTIRDLCRRYMEDVGPTKAKSTRDSDQRIIDVYIIPRLGNVKAAEIHEGDCEGLHKAVTASAGPVRANRVIALVSHMLNVAMKRQEGEGAPWRPVSLGNPVRGLKRNREHGRERFYSPAELARLADALDKYAREKGAAPANLIRWCALTGCRPGEAQLATWEQIDFEDGTWIKPSAHTKQRRTHRFPLSPAALELLQTIKADQEAQQKEGEAPCPYLFPGRKTKTSGWRPLAQYRLAWQEIVKDAKLEPDEEGHAPRVYDLRHSFASIGAGAGLSLPIIGRLLGHTQSRTTQRYAHLADDALREAATRITGVVAGAGKGQGAEVVPLKRGGGAA